jgi:hypothetical protein
MIRLSAAMFSVGMAIAGGVSVESPRTAQEDKGAFYAVSLTELVLAKDGKKGNSFITVKIDRKVPNDTGRVVFSDDKVMEMSTDSSEKEPTKESDKIVLVLSPKDAPLGIKTPEDLRSKLPLKVKLYLRRSRP